MRVEAAALESGWQTWVKSQVSHGGDVQAMGDTRSLDINFMSKKKTLAELSELRVFL